MAGKKKRLGEMLIEAGVIDQAQLQAALGYQRQWGGRLGHALVEMKLATEPRIVEALAAKFGYEVVRPGALDSGPLLESALALIPREFAIRNNVMAYEADTSTISVATADPANIAVLDEVQFRTGRRVKVSLAGEQELAEALRRFYGGGEERVDGISLDLESDTPQEAIATDSFGGGSTAELEQFFTSDPNPPPPAARPAPAPSAAPRAAPPSPDVTATPARAPAPSPTVAPAAAPVAPPAPRPTTSRRTAMPALPLPSEMFSGEVLDPTPTPTPLPLHLESLEPPKPSEALRPRPAPTAPPPAQPAAEPILDGEPLLVTELVAEEPAPPSRAPAPPAPAAKPSEEPALRADELALFASLEQLARGAAPSSAPNVKPTQLLAALIRLLIRKRVISELELIEELRKK